MYILFVRQAQWFFWHSFKNTVFTVITIYCNRYLTVPANISMWSDHQVGSATSQIGFGQHGWCIGLIGRAPPPGFPHGVRSGLSGQAFGWDSAPKVPLQKAHQSMAQVRKWDFPQRISTSFTEHNTTPSMPQNALKERENRNSREKWKRALSFKDYNNEMEATEELFQTCTEQVNAFAEVAATCVQQCWKGHQCGSLDLNSGRSVEKLLWLGRELITARACDFGAMHELWC